MRGEYHDNSRMIQKCLSAMVSGSTSIIRAVDDTIRAQQVVTQEHAIVN